MKIPAQNRVSLRAATLLLALVIANCGGAEDAGLTGENPDPKGGGASNGGGVDAGGQGGGGNSNGGGTNTGGAGASGGGTGGAGHSGGGSGGANAGSGGVGGANAGSGGVGPGGSNAGGTAGGAGAGGTVVPGDDPITWDTDAAGNDLCLDEYTVNCADDVCGEGLEECSMARCSSEAFAVTSLPFTLRLPTVTRQGTNCLLRCTFEQTTYSIALAVVPPVAQDTWLRVRVDAPWKIHVAESPTGCKVGAAGGARLWRRARMSP